MELSHQLANKAVQAAVAAIEIYNKPNFAYREEAFSLLMTNAWELLLKAKWLLDHTESIESLVEYDGPAGQRVQKRNRTGNPITYGVVYLASKLMEDKQSGLEKACHDNIICLIEIRDNACHFLNKDLYLGRRVLEVGTASLRNFLQLITEWFQMDLSQYNFFLMPISFYHGFETVEPASLSQYPEQVQRLLQFLDVLEDAVPTTEQTPKQSVMLRLETKLVRGKGSSGVPFRWTDDPAAPAMTIREEDILKNYPWTYRDLVESMRRRYVDFVENKAFHKLRQGLEKEKKFALTRLLNPSNPNSSRTRFFNPNILQEFDKHYKRRTKA